MEKRTAKKHQAIDIAELPLMAEDDIVDAAALTSIIERATKSPNYVGDARLTPQLATIAAMGYRHGLCLDSNEQYSQYDDMIRQKLYEEFTFAGDHLLDTPLFPTIYDVYASAALRALKQNRANKAIPELALAN